MNRPPKKMAPSVRPAAVKVVHRLRALNVVCTSDLHRFYRDMGRIRQQCPAVYAKLFARQPLVFLRIYGSVPGGDGAAIIDPRRPRPAT